MTASTSLAPWYLFDYGKVISHAPDPEDWAALQEATGRDLEPLDSGYWMHRADFDAGITSAAEYWSRVLDDEVSEGLVDRLEALDAKQWSHNNLETLDVLEMLKSTGARLALLSNMPAGMASEYSRQAPWVQYFDKLFFSGHLGLAKPDPQIFTHVLQELEADAGQVTFVDDVQANITAARSLGLRTVLHVPGIDLVAAFGL
jgi:putative hydrolase of the HAD superfamily